MISTIITMAGVGIIVPLTQSVIINIGATRIAAITGLFFFIEFICITISGYIVSLFAGKLFPMLSGISICWIIIYVAESFITKFATA